MKKNILSSTLIQLFTLQACYQQNNTELQSKKDAAEEFQVGEYSIKAELVKDSEGRFASINIKSSPNYSDYSAEAFRARFQLTADHLGAREYWDAFDTNLLERSERSATFSKGGDLKEIGHFDYITQRFLKFKYPDIFGRLDTNESVMRYFQTDPTGLPKSIKRVHALPQALTEHPLMVVHASAGFDWQKKAKKGIDRRIKQAKQKGRPVIYLISEMGSADLDWYTEDREPTYALLSAGGEHNLRLQASNITIIGGFVGDYDKAPGCHTRAIVDSISRYFVGKTEGTFRVHLPIDALYFYTDDHLPFEELEDDGDPRDFITTIYSSFFFTESQDYFGMHNKYSGRLTTSDYTFEFFVNGKHVDFKKRDFHPEYDQTKVGSGPRHVEFHFYTQDAR